MRSLMRSWTAGRLSTFHAAWLARLGLYPASTAARVALPPLATNPSTILFSRQVSAGFPVSGSILRLDIIRIPHHKTDLGAPDRLEAAGAGAGRPQRAARTRAFIVSGGDSGRHERLLSTYNSLA